jgi:hypothetical protein
MGTTQDGDGKNSSRLTDLSRCFPNSDDETRVASDEIESDYTVVIGYESDDGETVVASSELSALRDNGFVIRFISGNVLHINDATDPDE